MRSKTSFFNAAIYRHTLKRFWPLWGAYAMILFIITPLRLMGTNLTNYAQADKLYLVTGQILRAAWTDGCVLSFIMAAAPAENMEINTVLLLSGRDAISPVCRVLQRKLKTHMAVAAAIMNDIMHPVPQAVLMIYPETP